MRLASSLLQPVIHFIIIAAVAATIVTLEFSAAVAAPDSPDQNAKTSGVKIHEQDSSVSAASSFEIQTADGKASITIKTAAAPSLTGWAKHRLAPVLAAWYPKIVAMLPSPGYTAPAHFTITIKPMDGVAYTVGTRVFVSKKWVQDEMNGQAIGSLVHEMVHVVQQYGKYGGHHTPAWLVEGMADYIRWFKYEPQSHGADIVWMRRYGKNFSPHYNDSYRVSANFLNWVTENYDTNVVTQVNAVLREGNYTSAFWKQHTGKTVQELGAKWRKEIKTRLADSSAGASKKAG